NARSCGLFEEPRELLQLVCEDFREMYPNRSENYCCTGGGGAMSMGEYTPRRLKSGVIKANQLRETGAGIVVTSCHNCVDGLTDVIRHYKLGMEVTQLVNLVANAVVVEAKVAVPVAGAVTEPPFETEGLPLAGRVIVVADDEPDQVAFLTAVLEDNGATVHEATTGDQALEVARAIKPDLLTLDLSMPGKDVGEVYEILRADTDLGDLKICVITGRPELRKVIYDRTVRRPEGYMDKPVTEEGLIRNIRRILELAHEEELAPTS
ncbi:MAG: response regulator, partial [Gemmatimonadales bacterium]